MSSKSGASSASARGLRLAGGSRSAIAQGVELLAQTIAALMGTEAKDKNGFKVGRR